jgi:hypothetical protein
VPIASTKLGARKVAAARSSEAQAWVTERLQASSPGTVRLLVQNRAEPSNAGVQDCLVARSPVATNQPSKITAKGSSLSTNGSRYWPTASPELPHLRPAPRSIASHRCKRRPVTLAVATHRLGVSPDRCVLRWVLAVPSTVCLRGSFGSRERVASGDDLRS